MKHNLDHVFDLLKRYKSAEIDRTISPGDAMNDKWYFDVGRYAIEAISVACTRRDFATSSGCSISRAAMAASCGTWSSSSPPRNSWPATWTQTA